NGGAIASLDTILPEVGHMNECRAFQPDIDKCALHSWKDTHHLPKVQVAHMPPLDTALDMQLLDGALFHKGYPGFKWRNVYQYVFSHFVSMGRAGQFTQFRKWRVFILAFIYSRSGRPSIYK